MHPNFGDWYRAADLIPNHEDLVKRQAAIETFTEDATSEQIVELTRGYYGLGSQNASVSAMRDAMREADNAFAMSNNEVELRVLSGACLMQLLDGTNGTLAALALVCPAVMGSREGILIPDICQHASKFLDDLSLQLRTSKGLATPQATNTQIKDNLSGITTAAASNTFSVIVANHVTTALEALHTGVASLVRKCNKLEKNQLLFREDSEILWWLTGGHSRDLRKPLSGVDIVGAAAIVGKELADLIHVQPGPYAAQAVLDRCLQQHGGALRDSSLTQVVNKAPTEWKQLWKSSLDGLDTTLALCPVTCAIATSVEVPGEKKWQASFEARTGVDASLKRPLIDWAYQTYRESMFIRAIGR